MDDIKYAPVGNLQPGLAYGIPRWLGRFALAGSIIGSPNYLNEFED